MDRFRRHEARVANIRLILVISVSIGVVMFVIIMRLVRRFLGAMKEKQVKSRIEKPPEHRVFEEALSTAISVSKPELQRRLAESKGENVFPPCAIQVRPRKAPFLGNQF
jgi:hypothetical protein